MASRVSARFGRTFLQPARSIAPASSTRSCRRCSADSRRLRPSEAFALLTQRTAVLALQSGEPGPFAQAISGIDMAIWDLFARRGNTPLWRLLGGAGADIKVYASGINPVGSRAMAEAALRRGHRALKLKIGF